MHHDPPKLAVSEVVGYLKGKTAIAVARQFGGKQRNFGGENLWARGYAVSTVGFEFSQPTQLPSLRRLTTVKPPSLRERHNFYFWEIFYKVSLFQYHKMAFVNFLQFFIYP